MSAQTSDRDQVLNQLCDADSLWGPLLFLRPTRERRFGGARMLAICALFGTFYGMAMNLVLSVAHKPGAGAALPLYAAPLFLTLTSFLCGQLTFARAWNRRAYLLARREDWSRANAR